MRRFILVLAILSSSIVSASEMKWSLKNEYGLRFLVAYEENNSWKLEQFTAPNGEFQTKVKSFNFKGLELLKSFVSKNFAGYKQSSDVSYNIETTQLKGFWGKKNKQIWEDVNQWNADWELKYSKWVRENLSSDFFYKNNIHTDCADVIIGLRWIFARINKLPAANTLSGSRVIFSNRNILKSWKKLSTNEDWKKDRLFLTALNYMMENSYTHSVIQDSYPVEIGVDSFREGSFYLNIRDVSGHVRVVSEVNTGASFKIPVKMRASTVPRALRYLTDEIFLDFDRPVKGKSGFRSMRWPIRNGRKYYLKANSEHPTFGLNQYSELESTSEFFAIAVFQKLSPYFSSDSLIKSAIKNVSDFIKVREEIVKKGSIFCSKNNCEEGSSNYESYSTPSRDKKIFNLFYSVDKLIEELKRPFPLFRKKWIQALQRNSVHIQGKDVYLNQIEFMFKNGQFSSDPNDSELKRWALDSDSFVELISTKFSSLLKRRDDLISNQEDCSRSCLPQHSWWKKYNTHGIDYEIASFNSLYRSFCGFSRSLSCEKELLDSSKKITIQTKLKTLSLNEWMKLVPYFNSDPRVKEIERWGLSKKIKLFHFPGFESYRVSKTGLVEFNNRKLIDIESNENINIDRLNYIFLKENGQAFVKIGDELKIRLQNGEFSKSVTSSVGKITNFSWNKDLILVSGDGLYIYEYKNNALKLKYSNSNDYLKIGKDAYAIFSKDKNTTFISIDNGDIKEISLGNDRLFDWEYVGADDDYIVTRGHGERGNKGNWIFQLSTGNNTWIPYRDLLVDKYLGNGLWLYESNVGYSVGSVAALDKPIYVLPSSKFGAIKKSSTGQWITLIRGRERFAIHVNTKTKVVDEVKVNNRLVSNASSVMAWSNDQGETIFSSFDKSKESYVANHIWGTNAPGTDFVSWTYGRDYAEFALNGGLAKLGDNSNTPLLPILSIQKKYDFFKKQRRRKVESEKLIHTHYGVLVETYPGMWSLIRPN